MDYVSVLVRRVEEVGAEIVSRLENGARSGIVGLRIAGAQAFVERFLEERIRVTLRAGVVHVSRHFHSTEEGISNFSSVLEDHLRSGAKGGFDIIRMEGVQSVRCTIKMAM